MRKLVAYIHFQFNIRTAIHQKIKNCSKGENGEECIRRAICETMQIERSDSNDHSQISPDSFVKELLRTVFRWVFILKNLAENL